jgi:hypothetical protein
LLQTLGDGHKRLEFLRQILGDAHDSIKLFLYPKTKRLGRVSTISVDFLELATTDKAEHVDQLFPSTMEVMNVGRRDGAAPLDSEPTT